MRIYRLVCMLEEFRRKYGNQDITRVDILEEKGLLQIKYKDVNDGKVKGWQKPFRVGAN